MQNNLEMVTVHATPRNKYIPSSIRTCSTFVWAIEKEMVLLLLSDINFESPDAAPLKEPCSRPEVGNFGLKYTNLPLDHGSSGDYVEERCCFSTYCSVKSPRALTYISFFPPPSSQKGICIFSYPLFKLFCMLVTIAYLPLLPFISIISRKKIESLWRKRGTESGVWFFV